MKTYHGVLVPTCVLTFWNFIGLLPYPIRTDRSSPLHRILVWVLRVWTVLIFLLYGYFYVLEIIIFTRTYHSELIELEFFTLILAFYREYFFVLPLIFLPYLFIKCRVIPGMIIGVEASVTDILERHQLERVRRFYYGFFAFVLLVAAASAYCTYAGFDLMLMEMRVILPDTKWSGMQPVIIAPGGAMSFRAVAVIYGVAFSFGTFCWSVPPFLIVGLVLAVGYGFSNVRRNLQKVSSESYVKCGNVFAVCERLGRLRHDHRRLRDALNEINRAVAFIIVISTLGDIIMPVSLISRILQDDSKDFLAQMQNECQKYGVYFFAVSAIVQGVIRISVFVWMHEEAIKSKALLHDIGLHSQDLSLRDDARLFEQELVENEHDMAVSGLGFFSMTKLFAATLFGVILTYFLLIYEQKDQKSDLDQVSKEQAVGFASLSAQIETLARRLNETLSQCSAAN